MFKEFKEFALRGNALDLAVGVVIGAAVSAIVQSFVKDVFLQVIAAFIGTPDFSVYSLQISQPGDDTFIRFGMFVNAIVNLVVVAIALFLFVKIINRLMRPKGAEAHTNMRECPRCKESIPIEATRCRACTSEIDPVAA